MFNIKKYVLGFIFCLSNMSMVGNRLMIEHILSQDERESLRSVVLCARKIILSSFSLSEEASMYDHCCFNVLSMLNNKSYDYKLRWNGQIIIVEVEINLDKPVTYQLHDTWMREQILNWPEIQHKVQQALRAHQLRSIGLQ